MLAPPVPFRKVEPCRLESACATPPVRTEAVLLLAVSAGLGTSVLLGQRTSGEAMNVFHYHLDRLFPEPAG